MSLSVLFAEWRSSQQSDDVALRDVKVRRRPHLPVRCLVDLVRAAMTKGGPAAP